MPETLTAPPPAHPGAEFYSLEFLDVFRRCALEVTRAVRKDILRKDPQLESEYKELVNGYARPQLTRIPLNGQSEIVIPTEDVCCINPDKPLKFIGQPFFIDLLSGKNFLEAIKESYVLAKQLPVLKDVKTPPRLADIGYLLAFKKAFDYVSTLHQALLNFTNIAAVGSAMTKDNTDRQYLVVLDLKTRTLRPRELHSGVVPGDTALLLLV